MNFELTDKQALKIVDNIHAASFWMAGYGHFDLTREEMAEVIKLAFSSGATKRLPLYYEKLSSYKMG